MMVNSEGRLPVSERKRLNAADGRGHQNKLVTVLMYSETRNK